jgi:DNA (cytosine-5)-methyltransferase 1
MGHGDDMTSETLAIWLVSRSIHTADLRQDYLASINRPVHSSSGPPTVSLFSGILGIEIGLEWAGFKSRLALDLDSEAQGVVEANRGSLGDFPYLVGDINEISPQQILQESGLKPGEAALLAGGPPCQPFSKSGLRKGIDDGRGNLFSKYLEYLRVIRPQAFLLENVNARELRRDARGKSGQ